MKIAVVQTNPKFGDVHKNIDDAIKIMSSSPADFYVLPELFNTGYNFSNKDELEDLAEPIDGQTYTILQAYARQRQCYIVYGFAETDGIVFFNSAAMVGPEGLIGLYRKIHLFYREKLFFKKGNLGLPVFNTVFGKVGIMICFDWFFPEAMRTLTFKGSQLIAHPSNLVLPYCPDAMITRCLENKVFAATADRVGSEENTELKLSFIGKSEIINPKGEILCRLDEINEGVGIAEINLEEALNKKINEYNNLFEDRDERNYF